MKPYDYLLTFLSLWFFSEIDLRYSFKWLDQDLDHRRIAGTIKLVRLHQKIEIEKKKNTEDVRGLLRDPGNIQVVQNIRHPVDHLPVEDHVHRVGTVHQNMNIIRKKEIARVIMRRKIEDADPILAISMVAHDVQQAPLHHILQNHREKLKHHHDRTVITTSLSEV